MSLRQYSILFLAVPPVQETNPSTDTNSHSTFVQQENFGGLALFEDEQDETQRFENASGTVQSNKEYPSDGVQSNKECPSDGVQSNKECPSDVVQSNSVKTPPQYPVKTLADPSPPIVSNITNHQEIKSPYVTTMVSRLWQKDRHTFIVAHTLFIRRTRTVVGRSPVDIWTTHFEQCLNWPVHRPLTNRPTIQKV